MKNMGLNPKNCWIPLVSAVLLLLALTPSSAQILTYSTTTPLIQTAFSVGFSLPAFDSNLGTLQIIEMSFRVDGAGSVIFNSPGVVGGGAVTCTNNLTSSDVGFGISGPPPQVVVAASYGGYYPPGEATVNPSGSAPGDFSTSDPVSVAEWESPGGGTLNFNLSADAPNFGSPPGGGSFDSESFTESGSYSVIYTYIAAAPEPSTVGLMAAFLGIAVLFQALRFVRTS